MDSSRLSLCRVVSIELLPFLRRATLGTPSSKLQGVIHSELSKVCTLLDTIALQLSESPLPLGEEHPFQALSGLFSDKNETDKEGSSGVSTQSSNTDRTLVSKGTVALLEISGAAGHTLCSPPLVYGHQEACCSKLKTWLGVLRAGRRREVASSLNLSSHEDVFQPLEDSWSALGLACCGSEGNLPGALNLDHLVVLMCVLLSPLRSTSGGGALVDWLLLSPELFLTSTSLLHVSIAAASELSNPMPTFLPRALSASLSIAGGEYEKRSLLRPTESLLLSRLGVLTQSGWDKWLVEIGLRGLGMSGASVLCTHLSVAASTVFLTAQSPLVGLWETVCLEAAHSGISSSPLAQGSSSAASLAVRVLATVLNVIGGGAVLTCSRDTEIGAGTEELYGTGKNETSMSSSNPFDREKTPPISPLFLQHLGAGVGAACMAAVTPELARSLFSPSVLPGNPGLVISSAFPKVPSFTSPGKPPQSLPTSTLLPFQSPLPNVLEGSLSSTPSPALIVQAVAMASGLASTAALSAVRLYFDRLPGALTNIFAQLANDELGGGKSELPPLPPGISSRVSKCVTSAQTVFEGRRKAVPSGVQIEQSLQQSGAGVKAPPLTIPRPPPASASLSPLPSIASVLSFIPSPKLDAFNGRAFLPQPSSAIPTLAISLEGGSGEDEEEGEYTDDDEDKEKLASVREVEENPDTLHPYIQVRSDQPPLFLSPFASSSAPFSPVGHSTSGIPAFSAAMPAAHVMGEENDSDGEMEGEFLALPSSVAPSNTSPGVKLDLLLPAPLSSQPAPLILPFSQALPTSSIPLSTLRHEMDATIDALLTTPHDNPSRTHLLGNLKSLRDAIRAAETFSGGSGHLFRPREENDLIGTSSNRLLLSQKSGQEEPLSLSSLYPHVSPPLAPSFSLLTATRLSVNGYFGSDRNSPAPLLLSGQLSPAKKDSFFNRTGSTSTTRVSVAPPIPPSRTLSLQSTTVGKSSKLSLNTTRGLPRSSSVARGPSLLRPSLSRVSANSSGPPTASNNRVGKKSSSIGPSNPLSKRLAELATPRISLLTTRVTSKIQRAPSAQTRSSFTHQKVPVAPPPTLPQGKTRPSSSSFPSLPCNLPPPLPQRVSISLDLDAGFNHTPVHRNVISQTMSPLLDSPLPSQLNSPSKRGGPILSPPHHALMSKSFKGLPGRTPLRALFAPALESAAGIKPLPQKW